MTKKSTSKFGLLIVDDEKGMRQVYKEYLSGVKGHFILKHIWATKAEKDDAVKALEYIKEYKNRGDYHLLVITDAYMQPNCDGNEVEDTGKLFGGLWLINEVNKDPSLKDFTTILLTTYFDAKIQDYIYQRNTKLFSWTVEKDFYFVKKPVTVDDGYKQQEDGTKLLLDSPPEEVNNLFNEIFRVISEIINTKQVESPVIPNQNKHSLIGNSNNIKEVVEIINKVAKTDATILITGESGTGKEVVAKNIHDRSLRSNYPFIAFNCSSIPESLAESELFGYEKGAFTGAVRQKKGRFELANKGTIFLDEIGEMPLRIQPKILRALEEKEIERVGGEDTINVDVRIIAATNRDLEVMVSDGQFREDLYYRLLGIPIYLSPLRQRKEDIPLLIEHFLKIYNTNHSKSRSIKHEALTPLTNYPWPGNVRELRNLIERLVVLAEGETINYEDVHGALPKKPIKSKVQFYDRPTIREVEIEHIKYLLEELNGNVKDAAKIGGYGESTLHKKIIDYNLKHD